MALSHGKQVRPLTDGHGDYGPQKAGNKAYAGGVVMLDAAGRALAGATATGCMGVGVAKTNRDIDTYDNTSGQDGDITLEWDEGTFPVKNSSAGDAFATSDRPGIIVWMVDDETGAKTSGGGTRSPMGRLHHVDSAGVWVTMGKAIAGQLRDQQQRYLGGVGHSGAGAGTAVGAKVGDAVLSVVDLTDGSTITSGFEAAITVADQIQQSSATDYSAKKLLVVLGAI